MEMREAPYAKENHIDVARYLKINNKVGDVKMELTREEKIQLVKDKVGYEDITCNYLFNLYKYGDEALDKLVEALNK